MPGVVPVPLRILFWAWFLFALGVYLYRIGRRLSRRSVGVDQPAGGLAPTTLPSGPSFGERMAGAPPTLTEPVKDGAFVEAAIREELRAQGRLPDVETEPATEPPPSGRVGFFAGTPGERPAIADALAGVAVPDGLVPLMATALGEVGLHRALFIGTGLDPAVVGRHLGDELERVGYTLRSTSATSVEARRAGGLVRVVLHLDPANEHHDGSRAFPTARPGDLVVEFTN